MSATVPDTLEAEGVASPPRDDDADATASAPEVLDPEPREAGRPLPILAPADEVRLWEAPAHERKVRAGVLLGACLLFLPNLGAFGLWDPWETHYGAVTTEMLETYDWISPWWGYRDAIGDEPPQGEYFYSKPIFIFWSEAITARIIGRGEWSIRFPMALLAILAVFLAYLTLSKLWSRRIGLIGATVLATSPFFYMISRQAQTDMPIVATMTMGMCFIALAFFGPREKMSERRFLTWTWLTLGFILLNTLPQYGLLITDLDDPVPEGRGFLWMLGHKGWAHAFYYFVALGGVLTWFALQWTRERAQEGLSADFQHRWLRRYYLIAAYLLFAQSTYAKGLLGFMLPGAIILVYLILSVNWRVLARAELIRGGIIFLATCLPWYVAMLTRHGKPYWDRFFVHDHFKRAASGVHQIDSGTFEHFIKWLGVGLFPWVAVVPLALFWLVRLRSRDNSPPNQAKLFFAVWIAVAFTLFTWSSTKFHHYIFPAVPAIAVITALFLERMIATGGWFARFATVAGLVTIVAVGIDIREDPQHLRNLMTYRYDRPLPANLPLDPDARVSVDKDTYTWAESYFYRHTSPTLQSILQTSWFEYRTFILIVLVLGIIAMALFFVAFTRKAALVMLGLLAAALGAWSLNYYLPSLTPHWTQKYLFDAYYETCTKRPLDAYTIEGFEPLTVKLGLTSISEEASRGSWTTGMLRGEYKTVCEEDVLTWLITWRGETYYSWNEVIPIQKREQFLPYLRDMNRGEKFYIVTERGRRNAIQSDLRSHTERLKRDGVEAFADITDWEVEVINDENHFFQMVAATPIRGG